MVNPQPVEKGTSGHLGFDFCTWPSLESLLSAKKKDTQNLEKDLAAYHQMDQENPGELGNSWGRHARSQISDPNEGGQHLH